MNKAVKFLIAIVFLGLCLAGAVALVLRFTTKESVGRVGGEKMESRQAIANKIVRNVVYIKDPQANVCFVYYVHDPMTTVRLNVISCDEVSPESLVVAE